MSTHMDGMNAKKLKRPLGLALRCMLDETSLGKLRLPPLLAPNTASRALQATYAAR
jgi:hypothetical protein